MDQNGRAGQTLTSLDHSIRVGNSVVADPAVHAKALDWQAAFPEVFAQGGFDVVVGNPPYIRQEWLAPYKPYWQTTFKTFDAVADIFTYFFELGLNMLRDRGRLAFITSGSWVRGNYGSPLRKFIADNSVVESMIDFGEFQPFEDAEMIRPSITVLNKGRRRGNMRLFKWLVAGRPPENLSEIIEAAPTMRTDHLGRDAWELEPEDVIDLRKKLAANGTPLGQYIDGKILYGIKTGLTDVFTINDATRSELLSADSRSAEIMWPFVQGTNLRPWHIENPSLYLLALKSSNDFPWPWADAEDEAETIFQKTYPAIFEYLLPNKSRLQSRADQGRYWWELRSCAYWDSFAKPKIVWPDISKLPRFSLDRRGLCSGNTVYMIPRDDYYLLAVLSSWATWFFISKTAQPLRLRGDRWQYRLFTQYVEQLPIPNVADQDKRAIAKTAKRAGESGTTLYQLQTAVQHRLQTTFGESADGQRLGALNKKAQAWWEIAPNQLGAALKTSFKLATNPMLNPRTADEWEPYLAEKRGQVEQLTRDLADAEAEINDRVYRLFNLTADEVTLLQREVEH